MPYIPNKIDVLPSVSLAKKLYGLPNSFKKFVALVFLSLKLIPNILIFLFFSDKFNKYLCSARHGAHHEAKKLINVNLFSFKTSLEIKSLS